MPLFLSQFSTDLSAAELTERLNWMRVHRHDLAVHMQDMIIRGNVPVQSPELIMRQLLGFLAHLTQ